MVVLLILSLAVAASYLAFSAGRSGIPVSISATHYAHPAHKWLFPAAMGVTALTLYPAWISVSHEPTEGLAFGACASLLFVAASPCYDVTQMHLANIVTLTSVEEVKNYDYLSGYPKKLSF